MRVLIRPSLCATWTRVYMHCVQHVCAYWTIYVCSTYTCLCTCALCSACMYWSNHTHVQHVQVYAFVHCSQHICVLITGAPLNHLLLVICPLPNSYLLPQTGLGHDVCPFQVPIDSSPPMPGKTCLAVKCPEERTRKREVGDRFSSSPLNCEHHKKLLKIAF